LPQERPSARLSGIFTAPGRASALVLLVLLVILRALDPGFVESLALRSFDREQQIAPRAYQPDQAPPVRIVAIDDKTLAKYGQWPWPRTLVATLVRQIAAGHPRVLGVDIIFAESDRLSPSKLIEAHNCTLPKEVVVVRSGHNNTTSPTTPRPSPTLPRIET